MKKPVAGELRWKLLNGGLLLLMVGSIFVYAWVHYQVVEHGYRLVKVRHQEKIVQEKHKRLIMEIATLKQHDRLEKIGRRKFGLQYPKLGQKILLR
ncbi:MAG: cell division protein FtsL [Pseudomonadota bacterium]|nr:cell division protein FtsL [Pseudomonadota bacterium]